MLYNILFSAKFGKRKVWQKCNLTKKFGKNVKILITVAEL